MERKLLTIFKDICETNDKLIEKVDEIQPMCFLISKKNKIIPFPIGFKNQEEKIELRNKLKKLLSIATMKGYILIQDTKITMYDTKKKNAKPEVKDCILRSLYTPKENRIDMVIYEDKKITKREKMIDRKDGKKIMQSEWDLWGEGVKSSKKNRDAYHKFKMENKKLYDRVVEPFEDYTRIYSDGKKKESENIIFAYQFDHEKFIIRYYITDEFKEESEKKGFNIFSIFKMADYKLIQINKEEEEI